MSFIYLLATTLHTWHTINITFLGVPGLYTNTDIPHQRDNFIILLLMLATQHCNFY